MEAGGILRRQSYPINSAGRDLSRSLCGRLLRRFGEITSPPQSRGLQAGQDWHSANSAASGTELSDKEKEENGGRNSSVLTKGRRK